MRTLSLTGTLGVFLAMPALAQDSVSSTPTSLPGDALETYVGAQNHSLMRYVVDLDLFRGSWGTAFRIGPLVKASKSSSGFSNSLISAQAISATLKKGVPFSGSYSLWTSPGAGIHPTRNSAPGSTSPVGTSNQFAVTFADFGTTDVGRAYNGVIGAVVNYDPASPSRLYVRRISAATNGLAMTEDRSQFGVGSVDSDGNVYFRADAGAAGPLPITGNNIFRTNLLARTSGVFNKVDATGITQGDWLVVSSGTVHNTPSCIPADIATTPVYIGSNFAKNYLYEVLPGVVASTAAHRTGTTDHRGGVTWFKYDQFGSIGTGAMLGLDAAGDTRSIISWGTDLDGSVTANAVITVPPSVMDPATGFTIDTTGVSIHHKSQVAFRGGNGQVAMGLDQDFNYLQAMAIETVRGGGDSNPFNAIVVAKLNASASVLGWSTAAYVDALGQKKPLLDGCRNVIGELTELFNVTGGSPVGPSMSSPCMDSKGNVWFLSAVELFTAGPRGTPGNDFDTALVRGVYDRLNFSWDLELVLQLGQVLRGRNSGRNYQIQFMGIADSNSVSSGTMFSGNILQEALNGRNPAILVERDGRALGGIVVNAEIVYDVDNDGVFDDSLGVDQAYNTVLFISGDLNQKVLPACGVPADAGKRSL
jgi:hypothetical protein